MNVAIFDVCRTHRSPNLPAAYLDLARGMLLLATHSPSRDNSERVKAKAGWARELERDDLRHWAVKLFHRGARLRAWKAAGGAFPSLRYLCRSRGALRVLSRSVDSWALGSAQNVKPLASG